MADDSSYAEDTRMPGNEGWLRGRRTLLLVLLAAAALAALAAANAFAPGSGSGSVPVGRVERGPVQITINERGELRAASQATVSAPDDKVIVWLADEGARVKQGDELVRFESQKYVLSRDAAQSSHDVAQAQLRHAESELAGQLANQQKAYLDYQALPALAEKGFITQNELEASRLAYETVQAQTRSYRAHLDAARANLEHAGKGVEEQERRLGEGVVRAPRDGIVVYATHGDAVNPRKISVGMLPFEGQSLMYLPDPSTMTAETEISEHDLARVVVGSRVELRLDAYPEARFEGSVMRIGSLARQKISRVSGEPTGLKVFDVTIDLDANDERLRPGLSTDVEIVVDQYVDALYAPIAGIFIDELDRTVAYLRGKDGYQARVVEVAGSTDRVAVVGSGLEEGDEIALIRPPGE